MLKTILKGNSSLVDSTYAPEFSSLITYQFAPHPYPLTRLENASIFDDEIDGKRIYIIDEFFTEDDAKAMREYTQNATFSKESFGSEEAIKRGEVGARTMNNKERFLFFSMPPAPIVNLYKLLSGLSASMNATVTLLPWELSDGKGTFSPSVIANYFACNSKESRELGIHKDSEPSKKIAFTIPNLYKKNAHHPVTFINGERGKPLIMSLMLYVTAENFLPQYQLGTLFYDKKQEPVFCSSCEHMRIVLFEGDIDHSIQESNIPKNLGTWRVSYVYKLIFNPHHEGQCLRSSLHDFLVKYL